MNFEQSTQSTRRDIIKIVGGGAIVAGGGIAILASVNPAEAQLQTATNLEGVERTLNENGNVGDVILTGSVNGEYEAPSGNVERVVASAELEYQRRSGQQEIADRLSENLYAESTFDDVNESGGSISESFQLSLINDWGFRPEDFTPEPGQTVSHQFLLVAGFRLFDSTASDASPIASELNEDQGTVEITRERNEGPGNGNGNGNDNSGNGNGNSNDEPASIRLIKSEFRFEVQEQ